MLLCCLMFARLKACLSTPNYNLFFIYSIFFFKGRPLLLRHIILHDLKDTSFLVSWFFKALLLGSVDSLDFLDFSGSPPSSSEPSSLLPFLRAFKTCFLNPRNSDFNSRNSDFDTYSLFSSEFSGFAFSFFSFQP